MSWLRTIAAVAFALAFVCQPATSSAFVPASPEARVRAFEVVASTLVGGLGAATSGQHQGIGAAYDENASGYRFAAGGAKSAYEIAAAGGKHAGLLKNYAERSAAEIQKGITSLERQAALHREKIASPAQFAERWGQMSAQQQAGLLRYWQKEAARYQEQAEVLRGLLGGQ